MSNADASRPEEGKWPHWTNRVREVKDDALDSYLEDELDRARSEFHSAFGVASQHCESPIEALFLAAFLPHVLRDPSYRITPQEPIGDYRADFVVTFSPVEWFVRKMVVECDGHDYHDRTKEQAERDKRRDRAISAAGMPVFRFTGRELYRDANACVEEIIDFTQTTLLNEANAQLDAQRGGR